MSICGIIGQRDLNDVEYTDFDTLAIQLNALFAPGKPSKIISGGGRGVESLVELYAAEHGITMEVVRPNLRRYDGREAFEQRNAEVVALSDYMLIFWDGKHNKYEGVIRLAAIQRKLVTLVPMFA